MRKILLASSAMLVATAGAAFAQMGPGAMRESAYAGTSPNAPQSAAGANNNNNVQARAVAGPTSNPTPGTFVIRLGGRVNVEAGAGWSNVDSLAPPAATTSAKKNPYGIGTYMRLYPGLDAMATNGLRYGAGTEIRTNFPSTANGTGALTTAGGSGQTFANTLYMRRAFVYVAGENWGLLRAGISDGTLGLFDGGVTTAQNWSNSGVLNGGDATTVPPAITAMPFYWLALAGNEYGSNKIVYISPKIFGFELSGTYTPSVGNLYTSCTIAAANCSTLSSSGVVGDTSRYTDLYQVGVRYLENIGPVNLRAYGVYIGSSQVTYSGAVRPTGTVATGNFYNALDVGQVGVAATFAGITASANWIGGTMNGQLGLAPAGGAPLNATIVGLQYVTGPLTLGVTAAVADSQGAVALAGQTQLHEHAISAGGRYVVAPGLAVSFDYSYNERKQSGFNFVTGAPGAAFNTVRGQAVLVGMAVNW